MRTPAVEAVKRAAEGKPLRNRVNLKYLPENPRAAVFGDNHTVDSYFSKKD
eukprot:m.1594056 g.1594056  ORF g.1594056 m.1594056 type:complete len:51 (-) comp25341_c0_seq33:2019-2171(-)